MTGNALFTMLGYGDSFGLDVRSLKFQTEEMLVGEAAEVVNLIGNYNEFDCKQVAKTIKEIAALWQSDFQQIMFSVGREYSPVLYIYLPYWKSQTERFDRDALIRKSLALIKLCKPDELDEQEHIRGFRAWWD